MEIEKDWISKRIEIKFQIIIFEWRRLQILNRLLGGFKSKISLFLVIDILELFTINATSCVCINPVSVGIEKWKVL